MTKDWIYINEDNNTVRYVLGYKGKKTLFCVGTNPSTAKPEKLDNTLKSVERIALNNGYDSFVMFYVYAVRSTIFEELSQKENTYYRKRNKQEISQYIGSQEEPLNIWIAFGNLVDRRKYMKECMLDLMEVFEAHNINYWCAGVNDSGNPKHPLYLKKDLVLQPFDIQGYTKMKGWI